MEREIGDWTETIDYSDDDHKCLVLPNDIFVAAGKSNIQKVLNWLGPPPVDKQRLNARIPDLMDFTLVQFAVHCKKSNLLSILLQLGANVDGVNASGATSLALYGDDPEYDAQVRQLLEWGADISNCPTRSKDIFIERAIKRQHQTGKSAEIRVWGEKMRDYQLAKAS